MTKLTSTENGTGNERDSDGLAQKSDHSSSSSIARLSLRPSRPSIRSCVTGLFAADEILTNHSTVPALSFNDVHLKLLL